MNKNRKILIIGILIFSLLLMACGNEIIDSQEVGDLDLIQVEDDFGKNIQLDKAPVRIVSLSPSTTEILFSLGLDDEIVGVSEYCDYPKEALSKEKIGGFKDADMERIISLAPDIVISSGNENVEGNGILYDAGIQVATFNSGNINEVLGEIKRIGIITGKEEKSEEVINAMEMKKEEIQRKVQDSSLKKRVFYEMWHDPLMGAGKGSFMDELIELAGGENITGDINQPYPEVSIETVIVKNPEVYLTTDGGVGKVKSDIENRPGFSNIDGIKNGQIYFLDNNIVSRPGPRIVEALEIVYETLNH